MPEHTMSAIQYASVATAANWDNRNAKSMVFRLLNAIAQSSIARRNAANDIDAPDLRRPRYMSDVV